MIVVLQYPSEIIFKTILLEKDYFLGLIDTLRGKSCKMIILLKKLDQKNNILKIEEQIDESSDADLIKKLLERTLFILNNKISSTKVEILSLEEIKNYLEEEK